MPTFDLVLSRTNRPGLVPYTGGPLAVPFRPVLPPARLVGSVGPVLLTANVALPVIQQVVRQWRRPSCPPLTTAQLEGFVDLRGPAPVQWLETGAGVLGAWGTVRLVGLAAAALAGAAVPPAALVLAGGTALAGLAGSLAASHLRQISIAQQQNELQLGPASRLEYIEVDGGVCIYSLPPPAPVKLVVEGEGTIALPEWWAARPGADRPQLSLSFHGRLNGRLVTRLLNLPHYSGPESLTSAPIPAHKRGPWFSELVLLDNSRIRIFAESPAEGRRVIQAALQWVNPDFVPENPLDNIEVKQMKRSSVYAVFEVRPVRAVLWRRGQLTAVNGERPIVVWDSRL